MTRRSYFGGILWGMKTLGVGLKTTMREFFTKKITEQYPENRKELKMFDRFRGCLTMPHNENNEHKCVGCGLCMTACPNDTIKVVTETYDTPDGKKKRRLTEYDYNLGTCMFCMLCVNACPHDAITFSQEFENAVFDRSKLILRLNNEGSKLMERPAVAKPAAIKVTPKSVDENVGEKEPKVETPAKASADVENNPSDNSEQANTNS